MSDKKIYVGQIGVKIELQTQIPGEPPVDWSTATNRFITVKKPDLTSVSWVATLVGTTVLEYTTLTAEDLPIKGKYFIQSHVIGAGYNAHGATAEFEVYALYT